MTSVDPAVSPPRRRKRGPKPPRHVFDRRTRVGRRAVELAKAFCQTLGVDASDLALAAAIRRAAEVTALAEHLRARALRGEDVSPDDVLRMSRTSDALIRRLHLDRHRSPAPAQQSLQQYLRNGNENNTGG
jgi:hypothetical protein